MSLKKMKLEQHNICLWNNALNLKDRLINLITEQNYLKLLSLKYFSIESVEDQKKFCKMIYYKSETDFDLKVNRCGFNNFINIEIELNCSQEYMRTTRGISLVSKEIFFLKNFLRESLNTSDLIHCTDTEDESILLNYQLKNFFKITSKNNYVFSGLQDINVVKNILNKFTNYAVLRNPESFYKKNLHADVDILCCSREQIIRLLGAKSATNSRSRVLFEIPNLEATVYLDLRQIDDNYYPTKWQIQMLDNKIFNKKLNIYQISNIDQYYSLVYHAIIHKDNIAPDYTEKINIIYKQLTKDRLDEKNFVYHVDMLRRFLISNKIIISASADQTVGCTPSNIGIFNNFAIQNDDSHIMPSKNYLFQDRHAKHLISIAVKNDQPFFSKSGKFHKSKIYSMKVGNTNMVIKLCTAKSEFSARYIYSEHQALMLLDGVFCPKVYWYGFLPTVIGNNKYAYSIITESINGVTLKNLFENRIKANQSKITKPEAIILKTKITKAVNAINDVGVQHNDLRGENIIIDNKMNVKIIDFGLSRTSNSYYDNEIEKIIIKFSDNNKYNLRNDREALLMNIHLIDILISKL